MRHSNIKNRTSICLLALFVAFIALAQQQGGAIYIYCNDGSLNAFDRVEIDSIATSHYDLDSIYHKDVIIQDYYTPDSIYRIPIAMIDSVVFHKPEPVYAKDVKRIDDWIPYLVKIEEEPLALTFDSSLPYTAHEGDVLYYPVWDDERFPMGFAGKIIDKRLEDGITFTCDSAMIDDIFERLVIYSNTRLSGAPNENAPLKNIDIEGDVDASLKFDLDYTNENFELHESATFGTNLKVLIRLEPGHPLYTQVSLGGRVGLDINIGAHVESGEVQLPDEKNIGKFMTGAFINIPLDEFGLIRFKVRAAPIMKLYGKAEFEANLHAETGFNVDVTYFDGEASSKPTCYSECTWDARLSLNGSMFMGVRLYPYICGIANTFAVSFKVDAGPRADADFFLEAGSDKDIYDSLKDSKVSLYAGATFHIKPQFKVFNWSIGEVESLPQFSKDLFFHINDWYLLPTFTKPEVNFDTLNLTASAHSIPSRDLLMPVKVGLGLHDKSGTWLETQYCGQSYRTEKDWDPLNLSHQFAGLTDDEYTLYPYVNILGIDIKAKPSTVVNGDDTKGDNNVAEAVDLGLSVKWASINIGASAPDEFGDYFAWGETVPGESYTESESRWNRLSYSNLQSQGVIDANDNLISQYDAATVIWGRNWRMPTRDEIIELVDNCIWTWIEPSEECQSYGYYVTGPNGNTIFLPAAGKMRNNFFHQFREGYYWSATVPNDYADILAAELFFSNMQHRLHNGEYRYEGLSIRPVMDY